MISVSSTGSLTDALDDLNKQLTKAQREVAKTVAGVGRRVILEQAKQRRGTLSFSGMNVKRLGASAKITATPTRAVVKLTAKPAGPWAIVERGSDPHEIAPKVKRALFYDGRFAAHVSHPGARGFHIWDAATAGGGDSEIERAVTAVFDRNVEEAMG